MIGAKAISHLFQAREAVRPSIPKGEMVYAIGDIHGRADLLGRLLETVLEDMGGAPRPKLVCLGDYIDRGPDSRRVLDVLVELGRQSRIETRYLRGNHDQTLLDFLSDPSAGPDWCEFGGRETMASYGVTPPGGRVALKVWDETRSALAATLPPEHLEFLRNLELTFELGDYFFAHAGARPGVPLAQQTEQDLMWIRRPFLQDRRPFEKIVVHGHTPAEEAYADHRRIGLDTGAYATGVLSALRLEGDRRQLVQACGSLRGGIHIERQDI